MRLARLLPWLAATGALVLVLAVTHRHGLGVSLDSVAYARAAESLVERGRLEIPLTSWESEASYEPLSHFPPALPLIFAAVVRLLDVDPYTAGRWLNAACIFGTALMALLPVADSAVAVLTVAALLVGPSFVTMHVWLWSEPVFLLLVVLSARLAVRARTESATLRDVMLIAACAGLATLTRYAGLSLFAGLGLLLLFSAVSLKAKVRRIVWYCGFYTATVLPWFWWLSAIGAAPRSLGLYTENAWHGIVRPALRTVVGWFLPASLPLLPALAGVATVFVVLALVCIQRARAREDFHIGPVAYVAAVLLVVHVGFLVVARLIADPSMPFDERILSAALVLTALGLGEVAKSLYPVGLPVIPSVLLGVVALGNVMGTAPQLVHTVRHGEGYLSDPWTGSETIAWLRSAPPGLTIFSNAPDLICAWLPVTAKYTPAHYEMARLAELAARVDGSAPAVVVLFDDPHAGWLLPRAQLMDALTPDETRVLSDGVILSWGTTEG